MAATATILKVLMILGGINIIIRSSCSLALTIGVSIIVRERASANILSLPFRY